VRRWRAEAADIVLHPPGDTAGAAYKCPTAALVAHYLGAVPVVANEEAYDDWGPDQGVVRLGRDDLDLEAVIERARDAEWRVAMRRRLAASIDERFSGEIQLDLLRAYCQPPPREETQAARLRAGAEAVFGLRRSSLRLARVGRELRRNARR